MNRIHVCTNSIGGGKAEVQWYAGTKGSHGLLTYEYNPKDFFNDEYLKGIIEIDAIRHLILERHVIGNTIISGKGIMVYISSKMLFEQMRKGAKTSLDRFCHLFEMELDGIKFKAFDGFPEEADLSTCGSTETRTLDIKARLNSHVKTPSTLGEIAITRHAVMRYQQALEKLRSEAKLPFRSLVKLLQRKGLKEVDVSDDIQKRSVVKHLSGDSLHIYKYPDSPFNFKFLYNPDKGMTLVTIYIRPSVKYKENGAA